MKTREEIEHKLEVSLAKEIEERVEQYRDELELQAVRLGGTMYPPSEMKRILEFKREQIKKELMQPQDRDRIEKGFEAIDEKIESLPDKETIKKELEEAAKKFDQESLSDTIELQEQVGISNETYDTFYRIALDAMEEGLAANDVEKPLSIFLYLTYLNGLFFEPQLFLGYCYQTKQEYEMALNAYYHASTLNPKHPEPFLRSVECYIALDQKERAQEVLEIIETELADREDFPTYQATLTQLKESL